MEQQVILSILQNYQPAPHEKDLHAFLLSQYNDEEPAKPLEDVIAEYQPSNPFEQALLTAVKEMKKLDEVIRNEKLPVPRHLMGKAVHDYISSHDWDTGPITSKALIEHVGSRNAVERVLKEQVLAGNLVKVKNGIYDKVIVLPLEGE